MSLTKIKGFKFNFSFSTEHLMLSLKCYIRLIIFLEMRSDKIRNWI